MCPTSNPMFTYQRRACDFVHSFIMGFAKPGKTVLTLKQSPVCVHVVFVKQAAIYLVNLWRPAQTWVVVEERHHPQIQPASTCRWHQGRCALWYGRKGAVVPSQPAKVHYHWKRTVVILTKYSSPAAMGIQPVVIILSRWRRVRISDILHIMTDLESYHKLDNLRCYHWQLGDGSWSSGNVFFAWW